MIICSNCKKKIPKGKERKNKSRVLCEDCHVEELFSKDRKVISYEENSSSFMRRLKPPFDNRRLEINKE